MQQKEIHYSAINFFSIIGKREGFLPIKEFSLTNFEISSDERIDLALIKNGKVEYTFEFESQKISKSILLQRINKLNKIPKHIKKYIFYVSKNLICGDKICILYTNEDSLFEISEIFGGFNLNFLFFIV